MARRASRARSSASAAAEGRVESAPLEPLRTVRRELESPRGERVVVEVPVYPPFRLKDEREGESGSERRD